jgi:hypothetical protein
LQRAADEKLSQLIRRAAAVQEDRVVVVDERAGQCRNLPLSVPVQRLALVKVGQLGRRAGVKHPAVRPLGNARLFEEI